MRSGWWDSMGWLFKSKPKETDAYHLGEAICRGILKPTNDLSQEKYLIDGKPPNTLECTGANEAVEETSAQEDIKQSDITHIETFVVIKSEEDEQLDGDIVVGHRQHPSLLPFAIELAGVHENFTYDQCKRLNKVLSHVLKSHEDNVLNK